MWGSVDGGGGLGGCLAPFRCSRPWQQRELSVYLTVKACEKRRRERKKKRKRNREKENERGRAEKKKKKKKKQQEKATAGKVEVQEQGDQAPVDVIVGRFSRWTGRDGGRPPRMRRS